MKLLLDTHLLVWLSIAPERVAPSGMAVIADPASELFFSAVSIWELVIKAGLKRADFTVDPGLLRRGLIDRGYQELPVTGAHSLALAGLPPIHKDPFDRILVAQANAEGILLLTADVQLARYPGPIRLV